MNRFPEDFHGGLTGFGGDPAKNQSQHRAALKKAPIILCHGNGGNSVHQKWGMETLKGFLKEAGYQDEEIWAMDYLGEDNGNGDLNDPHRNHIDQFRGFVDAVRDYLGVKKLDFIAHSLGCGMVNAYLRGLQSDGRWDNSQNRLDAVGTFVALAGATYGLGTGALSEFKTGSSFEGNSHKFNDVIDDTPNGENTKQEQESPPEWVAVTSVDNDAVTYVAIIARGDFVDMQNPNTSRRVGANLNKVMNLGSAFDGHEKIIKSRTVFDAFKRFLNQAPPVPPMKITVDKDSGNYTSGLQVSVAAEPSDRQVSYRAERITEQFQAGFIVSNVLETHTGTLAGGGSMVLSNDGEWRVRFSGDGAQTVERIYGVNAAIPEVTILTDNHKPFVRSLSVDAKSTGGTLYFSTDGTHWTAGASMKLERTATVSFIAIDSGGLASPIVSRAFERQASYTDSQTASLTEHFVAHRLTVNDYMSLGMELGFNAVITLYKVGDKWVRDPDRVGAPAVRAAALAMPVPQAAILASDRPSGEYPSGFEATIQARSPEAGRVRTYYTTDGSDPSDERNPNRLSFTGEKKFPIEGNGHHSVLCYVQDTDGNRKFESFAWSIDDYEYPETSISPSAGGVYAKRVEVALHTSEPGQWIRYTTDGSEPSDTVGTNYVPGRPIMIDESTVLKFRSKDRAGNIEPVKVAEFTITPPSQEVAFANDPQKSGYLKGGAKEGEAHVGTCANFVVGTGRDGLENRAILHFDTSALPDNAAITYTHLELNVHSIAGDLAAAKTAMQLDVKNGHFGSSRTIRAHDWNAAATAEGVARMENLGMGVQRSTEFSEAGCAAINRAGDTQVRLRLEPPPAGRGSYLLLGQGGLARLVVRYTVATPNKGNQA